jgi:hypothetical protein
MRTSLNYYCFEQLMQQAKLVKPKNRLFRLNRQSANLIELLKALEDELSDDEINKEFSEHNNFEQCVENLLSLYRNKINSLDHEKFFFRTGQIAMLLDCIKFEETHGYQSNLVRLFA